jgi:hypothetical protein
MIFTSTLKKDHSPYLKSLCILPVVSINQVRSIATALVSTSNICLLMKRQDQEQCTSTVRTAVCPDMHGIT